MLRRDAPLELTETVGDWLGRKVKCQITKEIGSSDTFYKADNGLYYKSKELYEEYKTEAEYRRKIIDFFCIELLGYEKGCTFPTVLTKKLESLSAYSYKTISATILYKEEDLRYWASVEGKFKNDFGKICYLFVIIVNSINEVQKMVKAKENQLTSAVEIPPEIEDISNKTNQNKDISKWLEEDET